MSIPKIYTDETAARRHLVAGWSGVPATPIAVRVPRRRPDCLGGPVETYGSSMEHSAPKPLGNLVISPLPRLP